MNSHATHELETSLITLAQGCISREDVHPFNRWISTSQVIIQEQEYPSMIFIAILLLLLMNQVCFFYMSSVLLLVLRLNSSYSRFILFRIFIIEGIDVMKRLSYQERIFIPVTFATTKRVWLPRTFKQ